MQDQIPNGRGGGIRREDITKVKKPEDMRREEKRREEKRREEKKSEEKRREEK